MNPLPSGETAAKVCFGRDGGQSQDIAVEDLEYVAAYLRYTGASAEGSAALWTMPSGFDCEEWLVEVPGAGSVLVLAKHINPRITSAVLLTDIADTIDGGVDASDEDREKAIIDCGTGGGMLGVAADAQNPAYNTEEYKASGARPEGIIVKIVRAPSS